MWPNGQVQVVALVGVVERVHPCAIGIELIFAFGCAKVRTSILLEEACGLAQIKVAHHNSVLVITVDAFERSNEPARQALIDTQVGRPYLRPLKVLHNRV